MKNLLVVISLLFFVFNSEGQKLDTIENTDPHLEYDISFEDSNKLKPFGEEWNLDTINYCIVAEKKLNPVDSLSSQLIILNGKIKFLFDLEQLEKIHYLVSIYPLLNEILLKSNNIDSLQISYLNSLNEEILLLEESIKNKNKSVENKDSIISLLKTKNENYTKQIKNIKEKNQIEIQKMNKEIHRQKKITWIISGSSILFSVLLLIILL
jgi:hypothetical protein